MLKLMGKKMFTLYLSKPMCMYYRTGSLPPNLQAYESTGNGDCLFNSVSLALFGNERYAYRLRLAAVCDAILKSRLYKKVVGRIRFLGSSVGIPVLVWILW